MNTMRNVFEFAYMIFQIAVCLGIVLIPISVFISELCAAKASAGRR